MALCTSHCWTTTVSNVYLKHHVGCTDRRRFWVISAVKMKTKKIELPHFYNNGFYMEIIQPIFLGKKSYFPISPTFNYKHRVQSRVCSRSMRVKVFSLILSISKTFYSIHSGSIKIENWCCLPNSRYSIFKYTHSALEKSQKVS